MDFEFNEEQKMLKRAARDFWRNEISPIINEREKGDTFTKEEYLHFIKMLLPLGYIDGPALGLSLSSYAVLLEESAYWWPSLSSIIATCGGGPGATSRWPTELQARHAERVAAHDMIGCAGISEPNVGSAAPRGIEFKAVLDGDYWILNGTKTWTSNGCVSDYITVLTLLDRGKGVEGIGNIVVIREESPYQTREMHKMGWRCSSFSETSFVDCRVPKENLLPGGGEGDAGVAGGFNMARAGLSVRAVGLAQAAFDASLSYAQERQQFGKPIGAFQLIQDMLVDMATEIDCGRFLAYRAFDALDRRLPEARKYCSMAKGWNTQMVNRVAFKAVEIHGAVGVQTDAPIERYYRDARLFTIPDGTINVQKLVVGRELTGLNAIR